MPISQPNDQIAQAADQMQAIIDELKKFPPETLTKLELDKGLFSLTGLLSLFPRFAEAHSKLEREKQRLEVAAEITKLVGNTLDFSDVANQALQAIVNFLSTEKRQMVGTIQWLNHDTKELIDIAGIGYEAGQENIRVPLGKGVTGRVAQTGKPLVIEDVRVAPWKELYIDVMAGDMHSELAVPLVRDGEVWGVLNVESLMPNAFDENDLRLLQTIADQILIALRNAEAHSELGRERDRLEVAAKITGLVLGNTIGFNKVANRALTVAVSFLSTKEQKKRKVFGTLQRIDPKMKELVDVAGVGYEKGREDVRVPLGRGVTGRVAQTGRALLIKDLADSQWKDVYIDVMAGNMRSELAVPLLREGKVWGVLNVESPELAAFDKDDQLLLQTIADQILIALRNAEAHTKLEHEKNRLEVASQITGLVLGNTIGFDEEAGRALKAVVDFLSTNERQVFGTLQRLDSKTKELVDVAGVGYEKGRSDVRVRLGEGVTGRVAQTGIALLIKDLTDIQWKDIYIDVMAGNMRSELAVPLLRENKVWGVLNVESPELGAFDEDDQMLLQTIADQILIALRNAEAHEQLLQKQKLDRELQEAMEIQESITPKSLPKFKGFDFGAYTMPARKVGGDIYDFIRLDRDSIGVLIGDVVDKGVPASIFMAITKGLIRALATAALSPKEVLLAVNRHLYEMNTANMFVTMIYGVLERSRRFTYAQGGQGIPIVFDKKGNRMDVPNKTGWAIGPWSNSEINIYEHTITIPVGGTILLYTDGVTEAGNEQGDEFGKARLENLVRKNLNSSARRLCKLLVKSIDDFRGDADQVDDITFVAFRSR